MKLSRSESFSKIAEAVCNLLQDVVSGFVGKFLPFKTPLDARYSDQVPEECRFDLEMLFASLKSCKVISFFIHYSLNIGFQVIFS